MASASPDVAKSTSRNSSLRFSFEILSAIFTLITSIIVSRHLGPALKGTVATLSYMVALFAPLCAFGLGEAGVILISQGRTTLQHAFSSTIGALICTSTVGAVAVFVASLFSVGTLWREVLGPIVITACTLPVAAACGTIGLFVDAQARAGYTGATRAANTAVGALTTFVLVDLLAKWTVGAMAALAIGWSVALAMLLWKLKGASVKLIPRLDVAYLRQAVRIGAPIQVSYLLLVATARLDLVLVNSIADRRAAGLYSISLTVGTLVTYAPIAVSSATFPTIASLPVESWRAYVRRLCRLSLAGSICVAAVLAVLTPLFTAALFGRGFSPSITASLILIGTGIPWSIQWVLARSWAARGNARSHSALIASFGSSLVTMVTLDILLIPRFGIDGAAVAYLASTVIGGLVTVIPFVYSHGNIRAVLDLFPGFADFAEIFGVAFKLLRLR